MFDIELPKGNGQKIYIEKGWILANEETPIFINIPDDCETQGRKNKKEFIKYLESLGYIITSNPLEVDDNTFYFSPFYIEENYKNRECYIKEKQKKITECLKVTDIRRPKSVTFPKDHFPKRLPKLPFVLKNENEQGGIEKILIRTEEDLEKLRRFYEEIYEYSFQRDIEDFKKEYPWVKDVKFNPNGTSNTAWCINRINYKKYFHENMNIQEYIETPTEYNTSLRVMMASSGDILCASLKYSLPEEMKRKYFYILEKYLMVNDNPYFITDKPIISNTVAGGNSILLESKNYKEVEEYILSSHGIEPKNPEVPETVSYATKTIASTMQKELGAISGMDFIYDKNRKMWFYLEQHEYPMLTTYCEKYGIEYITDAGIEEFIRTNRPADMQARTHALSLYMKKKN